MATPEDILNVEIELSLDDLNSGYIDTVEVTTVSQNGRVVVTEDVLVVSSVEVSNG